MSVADAAPRRLRVGAREQRHVGRDLVVARARGVQLAADRAGQLGDAPLDRHVDVLVVRQERERPLLQLVLDRVERGEQLVAVVARDDPLRGEHARVGARLVDVVRAEAPVEADRGVELTEGGVLRLAEAGHAAGASGSLERSAAGSRAAPRATRATWPSLIAGKNGSASERAATSSQTGNSPSRWPKRSR